MHKKIPKICTGCRVSAAKIYLYHSTEIAKTRPHSKEWQTDISVQKQWSMDSQQGSDLATSGCNKTKSIGPILFLHYEESLVSSNLNSKLFRFHCVRPKLDNNLIAH